MRRPVRRCAHCGGCLGTEPQHDPKGVLRPWEAITCLACGREAEPERTRPEQLIRRRLSPDEREALIAAQGPPAYNGTNERELCRAARKAYWAERQ